MKENQTKQPNKNQILLITTQGCEGCNIMNKLLLESLNTLNIPIEYVRKDITDCNADFLNKHDITDMPTTLLFVNGVLHQKIVGTRSKFKILLTLTKTFN